MLEFLLDFGRSICTVARLRLEGRLDYKVLLAAVATKTEQRGIVHLVSNPRDFMVGLCLRYPYQFVPVGLEATHFGSRTNQGFAKERDDRAVLVGELAGLDWATLDLAAQTTPECFLDVVDSSKRKHLPAEGDRDDIVAVGPSAYSCPHAGASSQIRVELEHFTRAFHREGVALDEAID